MNDNEEDKNIDKSHRPNYLDYPRGPDGHCIGPRREGYYPEYEGIENCLHCKDDSCPHLQESWEYIGERSIYAFFHKTSPRNNELDNNSPNE